VKYLISVDQSTSGTKAALFDEKMRQLRCLRRPHRQFYPRPGWVEHDAQEIWENTAALLTEITEGIAAREIVGVGIANQRETTVLWDRATGTPLCRAIVWQDIRAKPVTDLLQGESDRISNSTGLRLSPYYSAAKAACVLRADSGIRDQAARGEVCIGTVDSYLLFRLTGGKSFFTDYTNASRTQLFDIHRLCWSEELTACFEIPRSALAEKVLPADSNFGLIRAPKKLAGVPVLSMLGDSHAAMFGHGCLQPGMVKTSYGTGSSLMMNVGETPVLSSNGLSSTVAFACGGKVFYALEGNITCSADTLIWIKDELGLIRDVSELDEAESVTSTDGVYLVPAFAGLGAPWFDENARGIICGMNRGTTRAHILRAALASIAHQNADVLDAMSLDTGTPAKEIRADGGGSVNGLLMQMQSDYTPCTVLVSAEKELTLTGAALMAGISAGLFSEDSFERETVRVYTAQMSEEQRRAERAGWVDAVRRCR